MARFAFVRAIDIWYERVKRQRPAQAAPPTRRSSPPRSPTEIRKAAHGVLEHDFPKLLERLASRTLIRDNPPLIYHPQHAEAVEFVGHLHSATAAIATTLAAERRVLLDRYALTDHAIKVVGVGSVGTRCGIFFANGRPRRCVVPASQGSPAVSAGALRRPARRYERPEPADRRSVSG